ncbi:pre-rRNA-processing protein TSR2 homolog [Eucyclogobius newberryi]|uniref:pre-rRNA-processing protein TSR2 homolog n=1 Tax=Eucyclogobius newberryi TaxID=166745 RepID=UPI003B5B2ED3
MAASSSASRELFTAGVRVVVHNWPVLQIAVDNGFGGVYGQQKADWMVDVLQQYFHDNADLQQFEVEDYISTLMDQEFDTVVDDGSLPQVSKDLLQMFVQWKQGALQQLQVSIDKHSQNKQRVKVTAAAPESDSGQESNGDDEFMECDAAAPAVNGTHPTTNPSSSSAVNQEEEDGWTVVRKKK